MTPNLLDELEKIVALSEKATPGKVELHTSCSWRRIVAEGGRPFLVPGIDPDRHPNMDTPESAEFVVALVNWFRTHAPTLADMAKRMEAAERDAARYRWLRDKAWSMPAIAQQELPAVAIFSGSGRRCKDVSGEEMDAAIDAAIDATQEGEG